MRELVSNAADEGQVKEARRREVSRDQQDGYDLKQALADPAMRRILWRVLEQCKTFGSVCHSSGSMTYYNSGKQDIGHWLMSEITRTNENALFQMMQENKKELKDA